MSILNARTGYRNGTTSGWVARSLFSVGDNLYAVVLDTSAVRIRVYKGTGDGTWTEQDSANAPLHSDAAHSYDAAMQLPGGNDDAAIYVAYRTAATTVRVRRFNTATDTWETSDVGGDVSATIIATAVMRMGVRSDGDILLWAADPRMKTFRNEGSDWALTDFGDSSYTVLDALMTGRSDEFAEELLTSDLKSVYRTITATNTTGMSGNFSGSAFGGPVIAKVFSSFSAYVYDSGTHRVGKLQAMPDGTSNFIHHTFNISTFSSGGTAVTGVVAASTTDQGIMGGVTVPYNGQWYVIWSGDGRGQIHYDHSDDYASPTFGTDSTIVASLSATDPAVYATATPTGVPVLYTDLTDPPAVDIVWAVGAPAVGGGAVVELAGAVAGTSAAGATQLSLNQPLAGAITCAAQVTATRLRLSHPLAAATSGVSVASAPRLRLSHPLNASAAGAATVTAALTVQGHAALAGATTGTSTATVPQLTLSQPLAAASLGSGLAGASALSVGHVLGATVSGTSQAATSGLRVGHALAGTVPGASLAVAGLTVQGHADLAGSGSGMSTAVASLLSLRQPLAGAVAGVAQAAALRLTVSQALLGQSAGSSAAIAEQLRIAHLLTGMTIGTADAMGELTSAMLFWGSFAGTPAISDVWSGIASIDDVWTGLPSIDDVWTGTPAIE